MTHHNNNKEHEKEEEEEGKNVIDQSDINQGADALPAPPESTIEVSEDELDSVFPDESEVEAEEKSRGKKGGGKKGSGKKGKKEDDIPDEPGKGIYKARYNSELAKNRDKIRCSNCGNSMTASGDMTVVPVDGKKIPKNKEGKYKYRSPGASKDDEMVGVFCDTCMIMGKSAGTMSANTIKTVVAMDKDGNIQNLRVRDLG